MRSGAGESWRHGGCRRPADGHDRHEDGGEGLLWCDVLVLNQNILL